jgi:hypothetical protein
MKQSKQVESYWIQKYDNGIYLLLFNTKDRWVYFHRFSDTMFQIGGDIDDLEENGHIQEIPEGLIPEDISFICTTLQEKDQISFYFIPKDIIFRNGEITIYDSKNPKKFIK